ncbi:MAG TPA: class I SAM-dependent methyltransferase [Nocardioides sp.]|uniref:class I SAM-dependent DNA methyltransferase n=1 Tax=Nocardioides sp. TaxID=35761 RepID=UPI002F3F2407
MVENWFVEDVAATYDEESADRFDPAVLDATVDFLAGLAGDGRALELAIGTGRVAVPLARRGVPVAGIELSPAMVARLRAKPGGSDLEVVEGDMSRARVDGDFSLVYLVYNTIANLTSQDAQVACFENAARHLAPGGCFVVELYVPALQRIRPGERFLVFAEEPGYHGFDEYDVATQAQWSHHLHLRDDGTYRRNSLPFRYAWPAELDLMARIAGLRLRERWADWDRMPYTAESEQHVSVWEKPA